MQGKYGEADPLYKRAIDINEKALGPEHPEVVRSLNTRVTGLEAQVLRPSLEASPRSVYRDPGGQMYLSSTACFSGHLYC